MVPHYRSHEGSMVLVFKVYFNIISQGVFAFKGKSKLVNIDNHLDDSKDKGRKVRSRLQNELWDDIYTQIDILRSDLNCQIFDDLIAFVSACHPHRHASGK